MLVFATWIGAKIVRDNKPLGAPGQHRGFARARFDEWESYRHCSRIFPISQMI